MRRTPSDLACLTASTAFNGDRKRTHATTTPGIGGWGVCERQAAHSKAQRRAVPALSRHTCCRCDVLEQQAIPGACHHKNGSTCSSSSSTGAGYARRCLAGALSAPFHNLIATICVICYLQLRLSGARLLCGHKVQQTPPGKQQQQQQRQPVRYCKHTSRFLIYTMHSIHHTFTNCLNVDRHSWMMSCSGQQWQ